MTSTLSAPPAPSMPSLAFPDLPERPALALPVEDPAFVVLTLRDSGRHGVKESSDTPLYDRLSQLAGMWLASESPRPARC